MTEEKLLSYCVAHGAYPHGTDPCHACIEDYKDRERQCRKHSKSTLVEVSYKIANALFKKVPKSNLSTGYIRGYSKAGTVAHDVLKKMIEEAE